MPRQLVVASNNHGKIAEFREGFARLDIALVPQSAFDIPAAEETEDNFVDNAMLKARNAAKHCTLPVLADDSGLEVVALGGAPGVCSARYAGPNASDALNNSRLLRELQDTEDRRASFSCVLVLAFGDDQSPALCVSASWPGVILKKPRGRGGFGYDPLFQAQGTDCSAAQLSAAVKRRISHRGQALKILLDILCP